MISITNILVATDVNYPSIVDDPSITALRYGRRFARTFEVRLEVRHVADDGTMIYGAES